jgi:hemoglobin
MFLTAGLMDGLTALAELPGGGYGAGSVVAGVSAVLVGTAWQLTNPIRIANADLPTLTPSSREAPHMSEAVVAPLDIPLDVIPRDDQNRTPYDIVGADTIRTVVDQFYSKVCADPDLADFFTNIDVKALKRHQALFIGQLWGGPVAYELEALAQAHQRLGISPERYWRVAGHLMVTLTHVNVPDWICIFTMTRLYQARALVIAQDTPSAATMQP